jgi:hypothetical protein
MFDNVGVANGAGVAAALLVGVSLFPTMVLQYCGSDWRRNTKLATA